MLTGDFCSSEYNLWYPFLNFIIILIHLFIFFKYFFKDVFIYFCCGGSLLLHLGFLQLRRAGAPDCSSFPGFGAQAVGVRVQRCGARA